MSAPGLPESVSKRLWRRWWFHLGALVILVPAIYLKSYMDVQALFLEARQEGERSTEIFVGPWRMQLQESGEIEPLWDPHEGWVKEFRILPCDGCAERIRAMFISLKRPGSSEYGVAFEGNPYRLFASMKLGRNPSADDKVWITVEGWDGSFHQTTVPLRTASPVSADWISQHK